MSAPATPLQGRTSVSVPTGQREIAPHYGGSDTGGPSKANLEAKGPCGTGLPTPLGQGDVQKKFSVKVTESFLKR